MESNPKPKRTFTLSKNFVIVILVLVIVTLSFVIVFFAIRQPASTITSYVGDGKSAPDERFIDVGLQGDLVIVVNTTNDGTSSYTFGNVSVGSHGPAEMFWLLNDSLVYHTHSPVSESEWNVKKSGNGKILNGNLIDVAFLNFVANANDANNTYQIIATRFRCSLWSGIPGISPAQDPFASYTTFLAAGILANNCSNSMSRQVLCVRTMIPGI